MGCARTGSVWVGDPDLRRLGCRCAGREERIGGSGDRSGATRREGSMGFSWTSAPDEAHGPSAPGASGRARVALLAAAVAAVDALVVVGVVTGTAARVLVAAIAALALWPALQGVERRWSDDWSAAAAQVRWLTPRPRPVDAALAGCPPLEGEARLLFV